MLMKKFYSRMILVLGFFRKYVPLSCNFSKNASGRCMNLGVNISSIPALVRLATAFSGDDA
jgi:hypothetical protein